MKWIGIAAALLLLVSSFLPWVFIESRNLTFTGVDTTGSRFGKPAYFHIVLLAVFLLFHLIPRVWAKRANLLVVAVNIGWAIRNFLVIAACQGGECPVRKMGLWLLLLSSLIILLAALFPDMKMNDEKQSSPG